MLSKVWIWPTLADIFNARWQLLVAECWFPSDNLYQVSTLTSPDHSYHWHDSLRYDDHLDIQPDVCPAISCIC